MNRYLSKKKRDENKALFESEKAITEKVGQTISDYQEYKREIANLRHDIIMQPGHKKRVPLPLGKRITGLHVLSQRSKGKVRDKCTAFYRASRGNNTFVTLTFIQGVNDQTAISILNKFMTQLKDDFGKKGIDDIWIAERQDENYKYPGNIHFHVIFNRRLPVVRYNALWVLQQYNAGLKYENVSISEIRERIANKTLQKILNPFDIKKIKTVYGLSWYLTQYVTKNQSEGFHCSAWHCSRKVSRLFIKTVITRSTFRAVESFANLKLDRKTGEVTLPQPCKGKFHVLYFIYNRKYFLQYMRELETVNKWVLGGMMPDDIPKIDDFDISKFYNN